MLVVFAACGAPPAAQPPPARRPPAGDLARAPDGLPDATVDCAGAGDFVTIQDAIDAAANKTWIEVLPCTYQERLDYGGKTLWISSTGGSAVTVLDAQGNGTAVKARQGEGDGTALVGFTIRDGSSPSVEVEMSALRLQDVAFASASGSYTVQSTSGDLELVDVVVDDTNQGSAFQVWADRGSLSAKRVTITCDNGSGLFTGHGGFVIDGSTIACSGGRAFETEHSVGRIQRSTLAGDVEILTEEEHPDDLIRVWNSSVDGDIEVEFGTFSLRNAVVTGQVTFTDVSPTVEIESSVFLSGQCAIGSDGPLGPIRSNDFAGGPSRCPPDADVVGSDGNLAAPPLFVDPANGDLHLQAGSPLIDAGVSDGAYDDVDGTRNDIGVYGGHFSQDGGW